MEKGINEKMFEEYEENRRAGQPAKLTMMDCISGVTPKSDMTWVLDGDTGEKIDNDDIFAACVGAGEVWRYAPFGQVESIPGSDEFCLLNMEMAGVKTFLVIPREYWEKILYLTSRFGEISKGIIPTEGMSLTCECRKIRLGMEKDGVVIPVPEK